VNLVGHLHIA
jgi:hypothetical protein